ncbi:MAG: hypothetical protein RL521_679 [Bacteroidota bacterium]|jgi:hypothetical protein
MAPVCVVSKNKKVSKQPVIKVVRILGGIGNQLFQVAFYYWLKKKFPQFDVYCDTHYFQSYGLHNGYLMPRVFQTNVREAPISILKKVSADEKSLLYRIRRKLNIRQPYFFEESEDIRFTYGKNWINNEHQYLEGYWQCFDYLKEYPEIIDHFQFEDFQDEKNIALKKQMAEHPSLSVHVRRGDYVKHPKYKDICTLEYYHQAIGYMLDHVPNCQIFVFSDDLPWCQENFKNYPCQFIDHNRGADSFKDMQLMSLCQHHIIANSSFSWWGAFLSQHQGITIAPKKWKNNMEGTRQLIPPHWIQL